ncbi:MAG TPA: hypothetical protein VHF89_03335 [Solirubrobacteraceae bacterium]|nr:hypothetical protein [Solirubrobacteraceae bacterium]
MQASLSSRARRLAFLLPLVAVAFAAAAGVDAVVDDRSPDAPTGGTDSTEGRVPDPLGEGPPWSVVVFRSRDGRTCTAVGRNVRGRVGAINDGEFHEYPIHEGASCMDLTKIPAGATVGSGAEPHVRTTVHGLAGPDVERIVLTTPEGTRDLPIVRRGAFLAVLEPSVEIPDVEVVAILKSGRELKLL